MKEEEKISGTADRDGGTRPAEKRTNGVSESAGGRRKLVVF